MERFWSKVRRGPGCWEWQAYRDRYGYGRFNHGGSMRQAHLVAYELAVGPVPEGLELDHTCRNRGCCNPAHLEPVTHQENCRRAGEAVTHCPQGHPYSQRDNRGRRVCRPCNAAAQRKRYQRAKALP